MSILLLLNSLVCSRSCSNYSYVCFALPLGPALLLKSFKPPESLCLCLSPILLWLPILVVYLSLFLSLGEGEGVSKA